MKTKHTKTFFNLIHILFLKYQYFSKNCYFKIFIMPYFFGLASLSSRLLAWLWLVVDAARLNLTNQDRAATGLQNRPSGGKVNKSYGDQKVARNEFEHFTLSVATCKLNTLAESDDGSENCLICNGVSLSRFYEIGSCCKIHRRSLWLVQSRGGQQPIKKKLKSNKF